MKRIHLLILTLFLSTNMGYTQKPEYKTEIDTLQVYADKVLVNYRQYMDSKLIEQFQAFLYPATLELRKSKWLPWFIKNTYITDSIVLHGETRYWLDGKYWIGKYENGHKVEMTYFNATGVKISKRDFYGGWKFEYDPEDGTGTYFIRGKKKRNK